MKNRIINLEIIGAFILIVSLALAPRSFAQVEGHAGMHHDAMAMDTQHDKEMSKSMMLSPHGGALHKTDEFLFEALFTELDVRVFVMNADGKMLPMKNVTGSVSFSNADGKPTALPLAWNSGKHDPVAANRIRPGTDVDASLGYLAAGANFETVADGKLDFNISLKNLPGKSEKSANWTVSYMRSPLFGKACPMHPDVAALEDGACSKCGGMALQSASVFYECCEGCGDMRMTSPGTCSKCGMELQPKAVNYDERAKIAPEQPRHDVHSH